MDKDTKRYLYNMEMLYVKALHLIFMVTWFSGLFYIVRLFVYHAEAIDKEEPARSILIKQYRLMEKRLWYGITWPGMVLTLVFGFWLLGSYDLMHIPSWLVLKLCLVLGLVGYHLYCQHLFNRFGTEKIPMKSLGLRMLNEVATLFLFAIIFTASVLRYNFSWPLLLGLIGFLAIIFGVAVLMYRNRRNRKREGQL